MTISHSDSLQDLPPLVPIERVAELFHVDPRTVHRWIRNGRLRVLRTSPGGAGRVLVEKAELRRLIEAMKETPPLGVE